ncbi:maltodextrin glucosidase [Corallincola spongiicola]|uniref:Maltodextrin glucosidase n=1 Tax=Corallincola spongiicola TaxID=2520508 RepID=A0ABY1WRR8_9GAMM|nr:maltodextrin glucosidase [Corallincola spongiicola]TAA47417.1 maltodextrin glucosidase [Corallincola spongiicola]
MATLPMHLCLAPFVTTTDSTVVISLLTNSSVSQVWLRAEPNNEEYLVTMHGQRDGRLSVPERANQLSWWRAELPLNPASDRNLYSFKYLRQAAPSDHGKNQHPQLQWLSQAGISYHPPARMHQFRYFSETNSKLSAPPNWLREQVLYQIFPDRFCNGDDMLTPQNAEYDYQEKPIQRKQWGERIDTKRASWEFFGGDLPGIEQQLDYLQSLGVTGLSLNPIFTSPSSHKYNPDSYDEVDPHLGGNRAFASLCQALQQRKMKLILDAVVNHTSNNHPWFNRWGQYPTNGAYLCQSSPFREFYNFCSQEPQSYVSWQGHSALPVLNYHSKRLQDLIYRTPDSALRRWFSPPYQIDSWRLDVAQMIGRGSGAQDNLQIVSEIHDAIRQSNADACLIGEHWCDASEWLQHGAEDGVMNYFGFTLPLWAFLCGRDVAGVSTQIDAATFEQWLAITREQNSFDHQLCQMNLLSGTDTPRFISLCHGNDALIKQGIQLLFTYPGMPTLLYGDEQGLEGDNARESRRCFPWHQVSCEPELSLSKRYRSHSPWFSVYQWFIALRQQHRTLRHGAYLPLYAQGDGFAFMRISADGSFISAINRHPQQPVMLRLSLSPLFVSGEVRCLITEQSFAINNGELFIELPPAGQRLLKCGISQLLQKQSTT